MAVLFTLGGVARFVPGSFAKAESADIETVIQTTAIDPVTASQQSLSSPTPTAAVCLTEATALLVAESQDSLAREQALLDQRRIEIDALLVELDRRRNKLQEVESLLQARWQKMRVRADEDVQHLAQMYGAMKAKEASEIFNRMDPGFAAGFLRELNSEQAGLILAGMNTEKAYVVSLKMASVNMDIRDGDINGAQ